MNIIEETKEFLDRQKMTQQELARLLGVNAVNLNTYLHGKRKRLGIGERLAIFLTEQRRLKDGEQSPEHE